MSEPVIATCTPEPRSGDFLHDVREKRRVGLAEEALASLERILEARPDHAAALVEQGEVLVGLHRIEEASDSFTLALAHDPSNARAWLGYGSLLRRAGRLEPAVQHLQKATSLSPSSSEAWFELALAFNAFGNTLEAARAYQHAIEADPEAPGACINLGLLYLAQLGEPQRAEPFFRRALALDGASVEAQVNLGLALHEQGRSEEALAHYDELVRAQPQCVEYRWHRGCVRLALGDFEHGWDDHEARRLREARWRAPFDLPQWDGRSLPRGQLLIHAEQGLGDEVMFASCIADAMAVAPCVIECDERLASLFRRSFPRASIEGVDRAADDRKWLNKYPQLAAQCAIGSLPRLFRRSRESFPERVSYLVPDAARVSRWREAMSPSREILNIGIAWRGGTRETRGELRSTSLIDWLPALNARCARFFALQANAPEELRRLHDEFGVTVHDGGLVHRDMDELAAMIAALDLVITVQGSVAHFAGAIGTPVWIVLSSNAEWRYLTHGEQMPWYSSARLFRRAPTESWSRVFERVAGALKSEF